METVASIAARATPAAAHAQPKATTRLLFVDNIRVFLTILVVLHHLMITYAGTGSWYYQEGKEDFVTGALGAWFQAANQAYFMGLFLLISAYFVPGSYDRKGAGPFLKDRLIRLGIPLALYSWIVRPVLIYIDPINGVGTRLAFSDYFPFQYFAHNALIGPGPLWFIEALLLFSCVYVLWRLVGLGRPTQASVETKFPTNGAIALFALLLGLASFIVRLWLPIMWNWELLNLQLPFFAQYIALFLVGLVAYRRNWLLRLPEATGRLWLGVGVFAMFVFWPMAILGGMDKNIQLFFGGWNWQAMAYALWESFVCVGMCIGQVYIFRLLANRQGTLARFLSPNAYAAYLIHGPVIVIVAYTARDIAIYPLLKWALVALIAVPLCFLISSLIRKLPHTQRILG
jgi:glucan biosynthesis protein C